MDGDTSSDICGRAHISCLSSDMSKAQKPEAGMIKVLEGLSMRKVLTQTWPTDAQSLSSSKFAL